MYKGTASFTINETVLSYQKHRYDRGVQIKEAVKSFHFGTHWLKDKDGMWKIVAHCRDVLYSDGHICGPQVGPLNRLADGIEDIAVEKQKTLPWVHCIDSMKSQGHMPRSTSPSSPSAFFAVFMRFPIDSTEWHVFDSLFERDSPWRRLKPFNTEALTYIEMIFGALIAD